jgi:mono/diheme cytochrome c family protein
MPGYQDQLSSDERWDVVFYIWRLSTSAQTLSVGKQAYDSNCASCHGGDGSGQLLGSADFTDLRQMDTLAPRDLYLTVTQGRGSMPAWQSLLGVDQRWAVIDYLRSFTYDPGLEFEVASVDSEDATPASTAACSVDQSNPFAWDDSEVIQAGQALYLVQCALCHGPDGSGGLPQTPDFTSAEVNAALIAEPGSFFCSVRDGKGVMPAFGNALTEEERWQVLTYMGSLGP